MRSGDHLRQEGFTLIETMVACVLLIGGMAATLGVLTQAGATTVKTRAREQATNLQRELVEASRSISYDRLNPASIGPSVRARPALGDSSVSQAGWTINRRGTTYTVSMGVCTVDDPGDGTGPHEGSVFCQPASQQPTAEQCASLITSSPIGAPPSPNAAANASAGACGIDVNLDGSVDGLASMTATSCAQSGAACSNPPDTNPADYKRVVSLVRWPGGYNLQTSQINNPGLAAAPAVTALTPSPATVTDPSTTSVALVIAATNSPATVGLYLDGTAAGNATPVTGGGWSGAWALGAVSPTLAEPSVAKPAAGEALDGSYQVSAKAFDQYGQYGATRTQVVVLNRRQAFAPARVAAGRNGTLVEVEWSAAKEGDSEGFRVDRRTGPSGAWGEVCARAVQTTCRDTNPPDPPAVPSDAGVQYSVVGYDRAPNGDLRAGDRSAVVSVDPAHAVPGPPTGFQANAAGADVKLTWSAPASGVVPDHYNVYRDGSTYAFRYDSAYFKPGDTLSYTDTRTTGQAHTYAITAVNDQLGESAKVGTAP